MFSCNLPQKRMYVVISCKLAIVCDDSPGSGIPGKAGDIFGFAGKVSQLKPKPSALLLPVSHSEERDQLMCGGASE